MTAKSDAHVWVIDSVEESSAAVEQDGSTVYQLPRFLLPAIAHEGDVCSVTVTDSATAGLRTIAVELDEKATRAAKDRSAAQVATKGNSNDPGGPIKL